MEELKDMMDFSNISSSALKKPVQTIKVSFLHYASHVRSYGAVV